MWSVHSTLASCAQAQIIRHRKFHGCYATWQKLANASLLSDGCYATWQKLANASLSSAEPCLCLRGVRVCFSFMCHACAILVKSTLALASHCIASKTHRPTPCSSAVCMSKDFCWVNLGQCFAIRMHHLVASRLQDSGCANPMPCAGLLWQEPWANY